jgi:lambda family phage minor tail protein L
MALSLTAIQEKNKLGTDSIFYVLLEIIIPGITDSITITNNGDDVPWNGKTWLAFPFEIQELTEDGSGEVPQWTISLDNRQRVIERYLSQYDQYLKVNGIEGNEIKCNCYVVNSKELDNTEPIKAVFFTLNQPKTTSETATFTLNADSPFGIIVPKRRFIQTYCYWKFKSTECGYIGTGSACDKSLEQCRSYGNTLRFGGFPSVGNSGIRL